MDDAGASLAEISRFFVRSLKTRFRDHRAELSIVRSHIAHRAGIACDIGANKGSFTLWLSRWCRGGRVVAFEPQIDLAARLARTCASIGLHNVQVEAKAVSAAPGLLPLFIPDGHQPGASLNRFAVADLAFTKATVPVVALDDFFPASERVSFLKVDVEGAELDVFRGATRILDRDRPLLLFECEGRHLGDASVSTVLSFLQSRGYEGRFVSAGRLLPVSMFAEAIHQRRDGEWFWKKEGYCNNFLFAPR
ncbi:FkbM family methyltransferase [Bradyrhizobium sp. Cp5.3]|uniref:FkbM family methyltransferase n=1 Tax=Bradyrhizobium sp. Cp5.3 TaxID=443598 RepID=UPI00048594A2|nr:FkbM family methyltransferase [Bradyrhizobium sp. Cp5.3]